MIARASGLQEDAWPDPKVLHRKNMGFNRIETIIDLLMRLLHFSIVH